MTKWIPRLRPSGPPDHLPSSSRYSCRHQGTCLAVVVVAVVADSSSASVGRVGLVWRRGGNSVRVAAAAAVAAEVGLPFPRRDWTGKVGPLPYSPMPSVETADRSFRRFQSKQQPEREPRRAQGTKKNRTRRCIIKSHAAFIFYQSILGLIMLKPVYTLQPMYILHDTKLPGGSESR